MKNKMHNNLNSDNEYNNIVGTNIDDYDILGAEFCFLDDDGNEITLTINDIEEVIGTNRVKDVLNSNISNKEKLIKLQSLYKKYLKTINDKSKKYNVFGIYGTKSEIMQIYRDKDAYIKYIETYHKVNMLGKEFDIKGEDIGLLTMSLLYQILVVSIFILSAIGFIDTKIAEFSITYTLVLVVGFTTLVRLFSRIVILLSED